ncbi:beta-lactamase family protein [Purpureocillium lilacinum]|uniref:Beta-lactamase family protein n=1 Tax=Purpureocillium lilacinum TaxID=33203 RepID=A0A179HLI1_PURLI|nr:beta-lactamase family protein [Purpureocillium lilacinum]OAQ83748.1 beta-lactamase family protein [Purpureocillium lilacinum]OAQ90528.1 beta-lactamase family protein [Purpureocillium lilacinum]PWI68748.1 hypothetical protein PCL_01837 [Purpureocillium lilacinum]GJN68096.1 hypothetical protein PLICBS_002139 [Purpureocillium lilacinum]GJN78234.1 hypothetical protein PLIIFM63780_001727 [Purpureocillium lilacinum]
MTFSKNATDQLRSVMRNAVAGPDGIPGATVVVVNRDGSELFAHSVGKRGGSIDEDMTLEHVYWIASCTKLLTAIACLQQVERGVLKLDASDQLEDLCPELKSLMVLGRNGDLEPKRKGITLRMLLTHTAGFGYSIFNEELRDWSLPMGIDEFACDFSELDVPLLFQPGEGWEYGVNMDWAGVALERATGSKLNDYILANICEPLGLENMNMFPTSKMKAVLVYMHQRSHDGTYSTRDHVYRRPLVALTKEQREALFHSGGAGMFAKPQEFCRVLCVLLNDGICPTTGAQLLRKSTVDEMFRNSIPDFPQFGRQGIPSAKPDLTNPIPDLYPTEGNSSQGFGLSFMLTGGATGRSAGTGWWAGLPNLFWWVDREHGVAGMVCTQILPFADPKALGLWVGIEAGVYQALAMKE